MKNPLYKVGDMVYAPQYYKNTPLQVIEVERVHNWEDEPGFNFEYEVKHSNGTTERFFEGWLEQNE